MTGRQRFLETMRYGTPDRVPYLEEGLRDDVLAQWHEQGLSADADLSRMFHFDRREQIPLDLGFRPALDAWPQSLKELHNVQVRLDPEDAGRYPADWKDLVRRWRSREHILEIFVHRGFFQTMGVNDWSRLEEVLYQVHDAPDLVRGIMGAYGAFVAQMVERVLSEVQVDLATFSEPIAGNDRPLLSPAIYDDLVLPSYLPIIEALRRGKVETIVYQTYANTRVLLPAVVRAGFNTLWAIETNPDAMDYRSIRSEFGREVRLIGGIDLDSLLLGPDAIRKEIEERAVPLLAGGGYIPLADGRVRGNVLFTSYCAYRKAIEEVTG